MKFRAFSAFSDASSSLYYDDIVNLLNSLQYGPAIEKLLQSWQNEEAFLALILFLVSIVILAWPPRRKQTVLAPPINQGVS